MKSLEDYTTYQEIKQQPELWRKTAAIINDNQKRIKDFLKPVMAHDDLRIILTGAGSSAYIGESVVPTLNKDGPLTFESIPTTDIVSNPESYLKKSRPTLLVSYARSGNSPESTASVDLADMLVDDVYHIILTCNEEGKLAQYASDNQRALAIYMPKEANDKGLAMTGSYSTMILASLLINRIQALPKLMESVEDAAMGGEALFDDETIETLSKASFERIIFLGSGPLRALSKEAELKMLELNAGRVVTRHESPLGFRHGPKSIVDENTLVCVFVSNDPYTRRYDLDLVRELKEEGIVQILTLDTNPSEDTIKTHYQPKMPSKLKGLEDAFLYLSFLVFAQKLAFMKSYQSGINPDNPSPEGIINRVVQGVRIHPYDKKERD